MSLIKPFAALRPTKQHAQQVIAPPYDVVSTDEARTIAENNQYSFLHISKPEIDLPADTSPYSDAVYQRGALNFSNLQEHGVLQRFTRPADRVEGSDACVAGPNTGAHGWGDELSRFRRDQSV